MLKTMKRYRKSAAALGTGAVAAATVAAATKAWQLNFGF
jgi:hypothetical protein